MPSYNYQCEDCKETKSFQMKITKFLEFKREEIECEVCHKGKMVQIVKPSHGKIHRDKEYLVEHAREEARKTIQKIKNGDEKTFIDIYGDAPNPQKIG
jgi:hypothetical protein